MLSGFKQFILRGNVVDLAVGVVIGAAFGGVVAAFVKSLIEPLIALLVGKPDFTAVRFTVGSTVFPIGAFITAIGTWWVQLRAGVMRMLPNFPGKSRLPPYGSTE